MSTGLGPRLAAKPALAPFPGWVLGSGQAADAATYARKKLWRLFRRPFAVRWFDDLQLTLYPGNEICRSIFVTGRYEPNEFSLLSKILKPGMTFVDVGANLGVYTLYAARKVGTDGCVISIEPSSREMEILKANVHANALSNVSLQQVALTEQASEVELLVACARQSGHNTLGSFGYNTSLNHREKIQTMRLDDLAQSIGIQRVDIIKMDIEGGELGALRGAVDTLRRHHPVLLLELSDRHLRYQNSSSADVLTLLAKYGYHTYGFALATGLPTLLRSRDYFDSENIVAISGDSLPF
jgi:FkbM family methyltransferase